MKILSKKLMIALMAISMATFPALNANAQAGGIAGVSATTAVIVGVVVVGAVAASNNDSGRANILAPLPQAPQTPATTTTTNNGSGGSSTTTTTTN